MPRPHIEFIQHQDMPFESMSLTGGGVTTPIGVKRLSTDEETGASSSLVQFPPGWRRPGTGHYLRDEEFYLLSGDLTISGVRYTEHTYAFLPSGYARTRTFSEGGAVLMAFFDRRGAWTDGEAPAATLDERRLVRSLNMFEAPW